MVRQNDIFKQICFGMSNSISNLKEKETSQMGAGEKLTLI